MKARYTVALFCFMFQTVIAQVGIGTTSPSASLDIQSSNQTTPSNTDGLLIPKIDEFPSSNPGANQDGMLVYATGNGAPAKGFYYWDNATTTWVNVKGVAVETDPKVGVLASGYVPRWNGTTLEDGAIFNSATNVGIGTATPTDELHVVGNIKMQDGKEDLGKVLTSDELGQASWEKLEIESFLSSPLEGDLSCLTLVSTLTTGAWPGGIEVVGNYAYEVNGFIDDMKVIDISNPVSPTVVGSVATGDQPRDLTISGNYAYVLNWQSNNMQIVEISNPTSPTIVSTVATGTWPSDVVVSGNYAYVANYGSHNVNVIDISNPISPVVIATISTGSSNANALDISGNYLYVAMSAFTYIIDVSNPLSPIVVGSISFSGVSHSIEVSGNFLYQTHATNNNFRVFDISNPISPTLVATVPTGALPAQIVVSGAYSYVLNASSNTLQVFNISSPNAPFNVATVPTGNGPTYLAFSDGYAYVTNYTNSNMQIFNLFCPENYAIALNPSTGETNAIPFTDSLLKDEDEDTLVQVEENADDDIIRFDTAGLERMVIAANGKVGIGTTNPSSIITNSKLDVIGGHVAVSNNYGMLSFNSANTGIGAGFDTTTSDGLDLYAGGANRVNVLANGDFRVDNTTLMVDASTDNVGIGIGTPSTKLHIFGANDASLANGSGLLVVGDESSLNIVFDRNEIMARNNGAASPLYLQQNGGAVYVNGAVVHASDRRLKTNIEDLNYGLTEILKLQPKAYHWKNRPQNKKSLGLIAQDVQLVINEIVTEQDSESQTLAVNYTELIPVLINATQEQQKLIEQQQQEIEALKSKLQEFEDLKNRLDSIEAKLDNTNQ